MTLYKPRDGSAGYNRVGGRAENHASGHRDAWRSGADFADHGGVMEAF